MENCVFYSLKCDGLILTTGSLDGVKSQRKEWSKKLNVPEEDIKIDSFSATI